MSSVLVIALCSPTIAVQCEPPTRFSSFLATFKQDAAAQGISSRVLVALDGLMPDPKVISLDRRQGHFDQSFEQFAAARITTGRLSKGSQMMQLKVAPFTSERYAVMRGPRIDTYVRRQPFDGQTAEEGLERLY